LDEELLFMLLKLCVNRQPLILNVTYDWSEIWMRHNKTIVSNNKCIVIDTQLKRITRNIYLYIKSISMYVLNEVTLLLVSLIQEHQFQQHQVNEPL
jgi:hypothetical protein